MYKAENKITAIVNIIFASGQPTSTSKVNGNGTETVTFNCIKEYNKFQKLYAKLNK